MSELKLVPLTFRVAKEFVNRHHSHHRAPQGAKFSIGVIKGEQLVGVVIVGRPVARMLDDGLTAEVTRCCTIREPNTASMLYGAACRAAKAMGYTRIVTYTLATEPGTCLKAAGWRRAGEAGGGTWSRPSRRREDAHPTEPKIRWEKELCRPQPV